MAYNKINWKDFPNTATPINATNLNKMDTGIATLFNSLNSGVQNWTPLLSNRTEDGLYPGNPTYTKYYEYAKYKQIGNLVYVTLHAKYKITNVGQNSSAYASVSHLPFPSKRDIDIQAFSINECSGAITPWGNENRNSEHGDGAVITIPGGIQTVTIHDASGVNNRKWRVGDVWIGFSGIYLIEGII